MSLTIMLAKQLPAHIAILVSRNDGIGPYLASGPPSGLRVTTRRSGAFDDRKVPDREERQKDGRGSSKDSSLRSVTVSDTERDISSPYEHYLSTT